jgi:hypothetical protein
MSGFQIVAIATLAAAGVITAQSQSTPKLTADDYIAIQQLYADYAHGLDEGKGDMFAGSFTEDGEFTGQRNPGAPPRQPVKGKEGLARMATRGPGSRHFISNLAITRTAEGAKASCYLIQFNTKAAPATVALIAVYEDTLVKTNQGWKFKSRVVWRDDDENSPFKPAPAPPGRGNGAPDAAGAPAAN